MANVGTATIEVHLDVGPALKQLDAFREALERADEQVKAFLAAQEDVIDVECEED